MSETESPVAKTQLERRVENLERLLEISRALNLNLNLDSLLSSIVAAATDLTQTEAASILLLDAKTGALYFEAASTDETETLARMKVPIENSIAGWIVTHGEPLVINDTSQDARHYNEADKIAHFVTRAILGVPLKVKNRTIGVLEVLNPIHQQPFTEDDTYILTTLAAQAAVAIENARLFEQSDQIADVIHELRTPMTSIIGFSKMLLTADGIAPEAQRTFLETISRESTRLGKMVNDFLDLARLETRRTRLEKLPIDVNEVVAEVVTLLVPQAEEQQLSLTFEAAPDSFTILGDRARLKQVMVNLIGNAVKYNKPNGRVQAILKHNGQSGEVIIADTGLGIPEPALERIFDKFYRVIEHQTEKKGTGLGLSIAKEIIEAHDGSISVTSIANEGSTFTITLPLKTG